MVHQQFEECVFELYLKNGGAPIIEGSLEVKLPTIWTDGKAEVGRVRERQRVRRKKMQVREKVGKPRPRHAFRT